MGLLAAAGCTSGRPGAVADSASKAPVSKTVTASAPGTVGSSSPGPAPVGATVSSHGSTPSASPTAPPQGCATSAACGFPDAATTGSRLTKLTAHSGNTEIRTDGEVIDGWDLHGSLDIYANNVTVVDSRITSTNWWGINLRDGYGGLKVLHDTIIGTSTGGLDNGGTDYGVSNDSSGSLEVGWCDISQFGAGISTGHGSLHDNYLHDQAMFINLSKEWVHTDSIISSGDDTAGLVIQHNTLVNQDPVDKGASASVGLFPDGGPVANSTVDDNWIAGGSYALYGGDTGSTGVRVTDNVFSTEISKNGGLYGFVAKWNFGGAGNVWSGNHTPAGVSVVPCAPSSGDC
jgi:hypothetical protein